MPLDDTASRLLDIANAAAGAASALPGLPVVVEGVRFALERIQLVRENKEACRAFREEVEKLESIIRDTKDEVENHTAEYEDDEGSKKAVFERLKEPEQLGTRKSELLSEMNTLKGEALKLKVGKGFGGFLKGLMFASRNAGTLADMNECLRRAVEHFKFCSGIATESMVQEIRNHLREVKDLQIVESIPFAEAGYRCVDELKSGFLPGTRASLFDEVERWAAGGVPEGRPKPVYLLTGGVGLGKSSVAHQLCVRVDAAQGARAPVLGASFFFVRGGGGLESARLFFPTLVRQLARARPDLRPSIVRAAQAHVQHGGQQQMARAVEELVRTPLRAAQTAASSPVRTLLVVDGVDECKDRELVPALLQHLLALVREFPWLCVFVTSRPERYTMDVLLSKDAVDIVHHRQLEDALTDARDDIRRYVQSEISSIPVYADYFGAHPGALDSLVERTGGVFIFARTAMSYLKNHPSRPGEQVEHVLSSGGSAGLALDALYLQVLRSSYPAESLSPGERERLQALLRFVALAREPMTPAMIAFLDDRLSVDDVEDIVRSLGSVLTIQGGAVVPLHDSFLEFLVDGTRCTDAAYCVSAPAGHAQLASACLEVFTFANFTELLVSQRMPEAVPERASLRYAMPGGLLHHLQHAEADERLATLLAQFVSGEQAAMYLWVMDARRLAQHLWRCLERSSTRVTTCAELLKFAAYVKRWRSGSPSEPHEAPPAISVEDVSAYLRAAYRSDAVFAGLDLSVHSEDLARYQETMVQFEQGIIQDHWAVVIWYDLVALNGVTFSAW